MIESEIEMEKKFVKKEEGLSAKLLKKVEPKKILHCKHDSFGGSTSKKVSSINKKDLLIKIEKNSETRNQITKLFYSPPKKNESSPKKISTNNIKEKLIIQSPNLKNEKVSTPTFFKISGLSPKKK